MSTKQQRPSAARGITAWPSVAGGTLNTARGRQIRRASERRVRQLVVYPPGYFTEPVRAWVQLQFVSRFESVARDMELQKRAVAAREAAKESGTGWGNGTMVLPNTPLNPPLEWLKR